MAITGAADEILVRALRIIGKRPKTHLGAYFPSRKVKIFMRSRTIVVCTSLALAFVAPNAFSEQPEHRDLVSHNMMTNAKCAGLAQILGDPDSSFEHKWEYFSESQSRGNDLDNEEVNSAFYMQFGWSQGFTQGLAFSEETTRAKEAQTAYKNLRCGAPLKEIALEIAEETRFVQDLRKRFPNLILNIEDVRDDEVEIYLGFDEGKGRTTRYGILKVDEYRTVYQNKDYHLGTNNWIAVQ